MGYMDRCDCWDNSCDNSPIGGQNVGVDCSDCSIIDNLNSIYYRLVYVYHPGD